jgi:hypothetical protein
MGFPIKLDSYVYIFYIVLLLQKNIGYLLYSRYFIYITSFSTKPLEEISHKPVTEGEATGSSYV